MEKGGLQSNLTSHATRRSVPLIASLVIIAYIYLVVLHVLPSTHYTGPVVAFGVSLVFILLGAYYYFFPAVTRSSRVMRLTCYYLVFLTTLVLVTGFYQPLAALFVLLFIAIHLNYGRNALAISMGAMIVIAVLDLIIRFPTNPAVIQQTLISVSIVICLGIVLVVLLAVHESRQQSLVHSQARERLQYDRILTIINNLTDATFSVNEKGSILMYNAVALDLLDTNDNIKGKSIGELFNLTDSDNQPVHLLDILKETKKSTRRDDLNHTYSDGETIRLEITFAPIRSSYSLNKKREEWGGYIIILRDITKQKSLEEERDEFISVVSHELRTPITIVEGTISNLNVIMKQSKTPNLELLASSLTTAHDQVLYLAKMVNDLSTLSRAERGVGDAIEEIDVQELLISLHHKYQDEATNRKLHLNIDLGTRLGKVNASRLYLEELLQNFITNALKYTSEGSVTIIARRSKNIVRFTIKDTGIGISRGDQAKVFNKFYRSEDYRIRETNGTGLGLYVSTKLAHKLHTKIELKSRLNHGSEFSFELPVQ